MNSTGKTKNGLKYTVVAAAMLASLWGQPAVAEDNISLDFRDTDIREIIKIIAQKSGTNIIAEKSVRGNVTVRLTDVYYEEAMNLIAKTNGFAVRKIGNTWILADEKKLIEAFEKGLTITKRLQYAKAADVSKIIAQTIKKDVKVATDDRINAVIVSGGKDILDEVKKLIETIDTPVHQVMMEAKIVEVKTTAAKKLGFAWKTGTKDTAGELDGSPTVFATKEYFAQNPDSSLYQNGFTNPQGELFGLGDFYRDTLLFQATLNALERHSETKILSNPKISAVNGQEANIVVGTKVIYPGGADQPPKEKDTGIKLKITPRINDDGYITVDAEPEVSFVESWSNNGMYPVIGTRSAKTQVRVRDGEEILIGGLIRDEEGREKSKIPLLGNIPILKSLFSYNGKNGESQELIILITPHIIAQSIESAAPTSIVPEAGSEMEPAPKTAPAAQPQPAGNAGDAFDNAFDTTF
ncbi:MAG: Type IV pilus biogenesis and competence protein PilQ precursor [bacterium ADurb.Bin374]|nr:MAG: Type IV pilus biogenesis and competence protein PilQ precursor [bacterium ADurb.Bin374]